MAANSSTVSDRIRRSHGGHNSVRKSAVPRERGTDISRASNEETTVPKMKGKAPNSPLTGFQVLVLKNLRPNLCSERLDCLTSSNKMSATITSRETAHAYTRSRKVLSASLPSLVVATGLGTTPS